MGMLLRYHAEAEAKAKAEAEKPEKPARKAKADKGE